MNDYTQKYQMRKSESCFDENELRDLYMQKLDNMPLEEKERIICVAKLLISEIKVRCPTVPFGMDSALQLMFVLGTYLNDSKAIGVSRRNFKV